MRVATRRHVELLYFWRLAKGVLSQEAIVTSVDKLSANLADFTQVLNSFAKDYQSDCRLFQTARICTLHIMIWLPLPRKPVHFELVQHEGERKCLTERTCETLVATTWGRSLSESPKLPQFPTCHISPQGSATKLTNLQCLSFARSSSFFNLCINCWHKAVKHCFYPDQS